MRFTKLFPSVKFLYRRLNYGKVWTRNYSAESGHGGAEKKGAVICVYEKNEQLELTPIGAQVDQQSGGKISQQLNMLSCELKLGKAFAVTDIMEYSVVAITSIGPKEACYDVLESLDESRENIRWGVGAGVKLLKERGCGVIEVDPVTAADAAAEAAELAAWKFEVFKSLGASKPPCLVRELGGARPALWGEGAERGRAQNWARCLSDMPANKMTPVDLAQASGPVHKYEVVRGSRGIRGINCRRTQLQAYLAALDCLCPLGVVVEAHDREWIEAQRMRAFLAVARGSCDTPMFLECSYRGAGPNAPPVLLAAKGVTFDSGGLCLKESAAMIENRGSMAGAAAVLAALKTVAALKLPINVAGVIPICENMVSGQCMKVGDVVQALNGLSIQIENTDMEGRLMMADALVYGQSIYKPSLVIDVATFTHGVLMATGGGAFGCFSNSDAAWRAVRCAGAASGDRAWRFPLWQYFQNQLTNDPSVDLRNRGCGHATPCLGAAFLKNFICGDWVHMDITGVGKVAHSGAPPYLDTYRMTGRPTRTIAVLIQQIAIASETCAPSTQTCPSSPQGSQPCAPSPPQRSQPCAQSPPQGSQPCASSPPQGNQPCAPSSPQRGQPCAPSPPQRGQPCAPSPPQRSQPCAQSPPQRSQPCAPSPPQRSQPCAPSPPQRSQPCAPSPPQRSQPCAQSPPQRSQPCAPSPPQRSQPCAPSPPQRSQPCAPSPPQRSQPCAQSPPQRSQPCAPSPPQGSQPCAPSPQQRRQPCAPSSPQRSQPCAPSPPQRRQPCAPSPPQGGQPCAQSPPQGSQPCAPSTPQGSQPCAPSPSQTCAPKPQTCAPTKHKCS